MTLLRMQNFYYKLPWLLRHGSFFFIVICMMSGCRKERAKPVVVRRQDQSMVVSSIEARCLDLYIPFGVISRELLFEASDSSIVQLRYEVATPTQELRHAYQTGMDAHGWVLKTDIDGDPKILLFKKPQASCVVYLRSLSENRAMIEVSIQWSGNKILL